jgi:hypothetical protein
MVTTPYSSAADLGGMSPTTGQYRGQGHPITPVCGSCLSRAADATGRYRDSPGSTVTPMTDHDAELDAIVADLEESSVVE